jgi:hypothetical protein
MNWCKYYNNNLDHTFFCAIFFQNVKIILGPGPLERIFVDFFEFLLPKQQSFLDWFYEI